ncbi:MAG TPA: carbohydrate kinase family protein [Chloroflexia bacterium]|nr:carbohydrate kinase family protein [Chloroflexia bacterium]
MNILSLGDLLLDVVVRYDPSSGEADTGPDAVRTLPGGSAANFAVHAARLGASVRFVSRVGSDWEGEMLARSLQLEGVEASVRTVQEAATGRVLVMVDAAGHRRMWSYPGASSTLSPDDLDPEWFNGLDAFHLTGYSLLREGPRAAALHGLDMARSGSSPLCSFDPNPPHLIVDYGAMRYRDLLARLQFDIIFPNLEEGKLLSGRETPGEIAASLLDVSPVVVLKLGERGCIVATHEGTLEVSAAQVDRVVDVTGAGDAFAAGFVVEYLKSRDPRQAAIAANMTAGEVVRRVGAR